MLPPNGRVPGGVGGAENILSPAVVYACVLRTIRKGRLMKQLLGTLLLFPLLAVCGLRAEAQAVQSLESIQSQQELDKTIGTLDAALFDAYNQCGLEKFESFISATVH